MDVDIPGQVAELDGQPSGEGDQQADGDQRDAERDEKAAERHDLSIAALGPAYQNWYYKL